MLETFHEACNVYRNQRSVEYNDVFIIQVANWLQVNKESEQK